MFFYLEAGVISRPNLKNNKCEEEEACEYKWATNEKTKEYE